jgi:hypothetical protein
VITAEEVIVYEICKCEIVERMIIKKGKTHFNQNEIKIN